MALMNCVKFIATTYFIRRMSQRDIRSVLLIGKKTEICRRCKEFRRLLEEWMSISGGVPGTSWGMGSVPDIIPLRMEESR